VLWLDEGGGVQSATIVAWRIIEAGIEDNLWAISYAGRRSNVVEQPDGVVYVIGDGGGVGGWWPSRLAWAEEQRAMRRRVELIGDRRQPERVET
jgi:hypothetical protein